MVRKLDWLRFWWWNYFPQSSRMNVSKKSYPIVYTRAKDEEYFDWHATRRPNNIANWSVLYNPLSWSNVQINPTECCSKRIQFAMLFGFHVICQNILRRLHARLLFIYEYTLMCILFDCWLIRWMADWLKTHQQRVGYI